MSKEIKRNNWSRFCKRFNAINRYRPTMLSVRQKGNKSDAMNLAPFLGITLTKKGRLIDGFQVLAGKWDAEQVVEPVLTIKDPAQVVVEKDKDGHDTRLRIRSGDGSEASLELTGDVDARQARSWVEKVAYSMYERRGYTPGNDYGDWLEAEKRVRQIETDLTQ